jgi:hypothetical protein
MKKFGTPSGAGPGVANEKVGLEGVGTPFAVNGGGGCGGPDGDPPPVPWLGVLGELPFVPPPGVGDCIWPVVVSAVPVRGGREPVDVDGDELPLGGGGLELVGVLEV